MSPHQSSELESVVFLSLTVWSEHENNEHVFLRMNLICLFTSCLRHFYVTVISLTS